MTRLIEAHERLPRKYELIAELDLRGRRLTDVRFGESSGYIIIIIKFLRVRNVCLAREFSHHYEHYENLPNEYWGVEVLFSGRQPMLPSLTLAR